MSINNYNLNYSKQYILIENLEKKALEKLKKEAKEVNLDDYIYKVVTTVSSKVYKGTLYHLIQCEDKLVGWLHLEDSIQIFRHDSVFHRLLEDKFETTELNTKMGIEKDFIAHFREKLLNVKSQITYNGEKYISIFLNNKFHGFHPAKYFDKFIDVEKPIEHSYLEDDLIFYAQSNLSAEIEVEQIDHLELLHVFPQSKIAKIRVNHKENLWTDLDKLNLDINEYKASETSDEELLVNDIMYSVSKERQKSKDILKSLISAKDYLSNRETSITESQLDNIEETDQLKSDIKELEKEIKTLSNQIRLSEKRLNHQRDYNSRLEEQKNKYKARMELVEGKMKNLIDKNEDLKSKLQSTRKR